MGGSTSDHFGLPLEIGPAALVELTGAARAARPPVAEYGGSVDQAEELAAKLTLCVARIDDELELERAGRELAERLLARCRKALHESETELARVRAELARERRGLRETYTREGGRS